MNKQRQLVDASSGIRQELLRFAVRLAGPMWRLLNDPAVFGPMKRVPGTFYVTVANDADLHTTVVPTVHFRAANEGPLQCDFQQEFVLRIEAPSETLIVTVPLDEFSLFGPMGDPGPNPEPLPSLGSH